MLWYPSHSWPPPRLTAATVAEVRRPFFLLVFALALHAVSPTWVVHLACWTELA